MIFVPDTGTLSGMTAFERRLNSLHYHKDTYLGKYTGYRKIF